MKQFYFFLVVLLFSCSKKELSERENLLIEMSKFSNILKEVYLSESSFDLRKNNHKDMAEDIRTLEYQMIYNKYDINEESFFFSLEYYTERIEGLEVIYSEILSRLQEEQSDL